MRPSQHLQALGKTAELAGVHARQVTPSSLTQADRMLCSEPVGPLARFQPCSRSCPVCLGCRPALPRLWLAAWRPAKAPGAGKAAGSLFENLVGVASDLELTRGKSWPGFLTADEEQSADKAKHGCGGPCRALGVHGRGWQALASMHTSVVRRWSGLVRAGVRTSCLMTGRNHGTCLTQAG